MVNKFAIRLAAVSAAAASALCAQDLTLTPQSFNVSFPTDSPVTYTSLSTDHSSATARGSAVVLDLHMALMLRNSSPGRIHALTLTVKAQEVTVGGKGRVSLSGLNVGP